VVGCWDHTKKEWEARGCMPSEREGPKNILKYFSRFFQGGGGGVTPQGGRTTCEKGKEREAINDGKGEEVS
jgi:hypothetical protein